MDSNDVKEILEIGGEQRPAQPVEQPKISKDIIMNPVKVKNMSSSPWAGGGGVVEISVCMVKYGYSFPSTCCLVFDRILARRRSQNHQLVCVDRRG